MQDERPFSSPYLQQTQDARKIMQTMCILNFVMILSGKLSGFGKVLESLLCLTAVKVSFL